jgi:serine/threonine-protein kinase
MTPDRWEKLAQIFHVVADRPPQERAALLDETCAGDEELRREVEELLASDGAAEHELESITPRLAAGLIAESQHEDRVGCVLGRYHILSALGSGGMGEVYLADDTVLERKVALKLLPRAFTDNADRVRRFAKEARAASGLNHPNILTIHEIGQADGEHFIAMEYVDGETLRQLLQRGPVSFGEAVRIGEQAAGALSAAHTAGIVHRDIKPDNIMLRRDGYIKVLDFGLAKLVNHSRPIEHSVTEPGRVMGTVHYMSPEQAIGEAVDPRSDIFSLGAVLHELATGQRLFQGKSEAAVYNSILNKPLPSIPGAPPQFEQVLRRALEKNPGDRYQSAEDFAADLRLLAQGASETEAARAAAARRKTAGRARARRLVIVATLIGGFAAALFFSGRFAGQKTTPTPNEIAPKSIAVLPFLDLSPGKDQEYLSDGVAEEISNALGRVKDLKVAGRTSSFSFKGKNADAHSIGEKLRVAHVLEGSLRRYGDKLRITAQVVQTSDGFRLWSETYERSMKDILAVEADVAQRVVEVMKIELGMDQVRGLTRKAMENPEAHRLYLLGRYHMNRFTQADATAATDYFNQALQADPTFAPAYCGLADSYLMTGGNAVTSREAWARQKLFAQRALAIDPDLPEARLALGRALMDSFDWSGGKKEVDRALDLDPNLASAYEASARFFTTFGRFNEAIENARKALELDPLNPFFNSRLGGSLYWARRYDDAIIQFHRTIELFPSDAFAHFELAWCLTEKGEPAGAVTELQKATELDDQPWYFGWLGYAYAVSGERAKAEDILRKLDELAKVRHVNPGARMPVYLGLGDKGKTLDWLEKCYEEQDFACGRLKIDKRFDVLRNEPRFQALLKNVGLDN